jgi:hypothetical protein
MLGRRTDWQTADVEIERRPKISHAEEGGGEGIPEARLGAEPLGKKLALLVRLA